MNSPSLNKDSSAFSTVLASLFLLMVAAFFSSSLAVAKPGSAHLVETVPVPPVAQQATRAPLREVAIEPFVVTATRLK